MYMFCVFSIYFQAQNRGATKFISSPEHVPQNVDYWNIAKINTQPIDRRISDDTNTGLALEPEVESRKPLRRIRGRTRSTVVPATTKATTTTTTSTASAIEESTFGDYMRNAPVVRVRGRNRNKILENVSTSEHNEASSMRTSTKKSPHQVALKELTVSSRPSAVARNETIPTRGQRPSNHRNDDETVSNALQNVNGRRIRVRVVQPNNAVADDANMMTKNEMETLQRHRPKPMPPMHRVVEIPDEPNYPEHFKELLKAKNTPETTVTKPEDRRSNLFPAKKFLPKAVTTSTTTLPSISEKATSITSPRIPYKHKKIVRPNKLLFPSLQTSLTTTTTTVRPTEDTIANDANQMVAALTEKVLLPYSNAGSSTSTLRQSTPTTKFSSKIRNIEPLPSSGFKMRVIATGVNGSQEIISKNEPTPDSTHQRSSAVSFHFKFDTKSNQIEKKKSNFHEFSHSHRLTMHPNLALVIKMVKFLNHNRLFVRHLDVIDHSIRQQHHHSQLNR